MTFTERWEETGRKSGSLDLGLEKVVGAEGSRSHRWIRRTQEKTKKRGKEKDPAGMLWRIRYQRN